MRISLQATCNEKLSQSYRVFSCFPQDFAPIASSRLIWSGVINPADGTSQNVAAQVGVWRVSAPNAINASYISRSDCRMIAAQNWDDMSSSRRPTSSGGGYLQGRRSVRVNPAGAIFHRKPSLAEGGNSASRRISSDLMAGFSHLPECVLKVKSRT